MQPWTNGLRRKGRSWVSIRRKTSDALVWSARKDLTCPGRISTDEGREGMDGAYKDGPPTAMGLGLLRIGNVALVTVNGEAYNEISLRLKRESPLANTVMAAVSNGGG